MLNVALTHKKYINGDSHQIRVGLNKHVRFISISSIRFRFDIVDIARTDWLFKSRQYPVLTYFVAQFKGDILIFLHGLFISYTNWVANNIRRVAQG